MKTNNDKSVFPKEEMWLVFLMMGFLGALTIAREDFILVYQGRISGQHAVAIGYLLAGMASVGLFKSYKAFQKPMEKIPRFSKIFWAVYASCMALPFVFDRLELPQPTEGILLVCPAVAIMALGHNFYSKLRSVSAGRFPEENKEK